MSCSFASRLAPLVVVAALSSGGSIVSAQSRPTFSAAVEDLGPQFTSNAFLSEKNVRSDLLTSPAVRIKASGQFAPGLAYSLGAAMVNSRFRRYSELDDDTVALSGGIFYTAGPWTFAAQYSPKWVYTRDFGSLGAELHDFVGAIEGEFSWLGATVSPALNVRRRFSDSDLSEHTRLGAGVEFAWKTSASGKLKAAPGISYTIFDASPVVGVDREDLWAGLDLAYECTVAPFKLVLSTSVGYNNSTVDRSWKSFGASPSLTLSTKF